MAIGIAVLRHRLRDIEIDFLKTRQYRGVTAVLQTELTKVVQETLHPEMVLIWLKQ